MFGVFGSLLLLLIAFAAGGFVTLVVLLAVSNVLQERAAKPGRSGANSREPVKEHVSAVLRDIPSGSARSIH